MILYVMFRSHEISKILSISFGLSYNRTICVIVIFLYFSLKILKIENREEEGKGKEPIYALVYIGLSRKVRTVIKEANFGFPAILSTYK